MDAELHDGTILEFPDGTSPEVIQATVKRVLAEKYPPPKAPTSIRDTAVSLAQGVVGAGKSLSDVFGADNAVSGALGSAQQALSESYTPERQAELQRRAVTTEAAAKSGSAMEEIGAFLGGVKEAPLQSLMQGLGSFAPYVATGLLGLGAKTVVAVNTLLGTAQGAGTIKGTLYDNVKAELIRQKVDPAEAEARAVKAQETLGENFLNIAAGSGLGAAGARFGVENLLSRSGAAKANASLLPRVGTAILGEAPLEGAQAGQEQYASNVALQREGIDTPAFQGVLGAAARDAAVGAMTAGTVGAVRGPGAPPSSPGVQPQGQAPIEAIPQAPVEEIPQNSLQDGVAAGIEAIGAAPVVPAPVVPAPVVPAAAAASATYAELKAKHKTFRPFMASADATSANMQVWYAENEKRLATGTDARRTTALGNQQVELRKALATAPAAAPAAPAAPAVAKTRVAAPVVKEEEAVVAGGISAEDALKARTAQLEADKNAEIQKGIADANAKQLVTDTLAKRAGVSLQSPATEGRTPLATNGTGVANNLGAADNTPKRKIKKPVALDLKATVVEPDATEVARRAAADAEKLAQLAAAKPKRVIKKSEAGVAKELAAKKLADEATAKKAADKKLADEAAARVAADKEKAAKAAAAKKLADKELADKEKAAKAAAAKELAKKKKADKAATVVPEEEDKVAQTDEDISFAALDTETDRKKYIAHVAILLETESGRKRLATVTEGTTKERMYTVSKDDIAEATAINDKRTGRNKIATERDVVTRHEDVKDRLSDLYTDYQNAVADEDVAVQASIDEDIKKAEAKRKDIVKEAEEQGVTLKGKKVAYVGKSTGKQKRFSLGEEAAARTDHTAKEVADTLRKEFGDTSGFDKLVTVHQTESDLLAAYPEIAAHRDYYPGVRGVAHRGKVHLVADRIERGQELGVFLHEAGAHLGFDRLEKEGNLDRKLLADQVRKWAQGNDRKAEVAQVAIAKGINDDEIIAYTVEGLVDSGVTPTGFRLESTWLRKIMAAFQTLLNKLGMRHDITPQELVDLAAGAAGITLETKGINWGDMSEIPFVKDIRDNPIYHASYKGIRADMVQMSPDEYLRLANQYTGSDYLQEWKMKELREAVQDGKTISLPFLAFSSEDNNKEVTGQEGRHRAALAKEMGLTSIPVVVVTKTKRNQKLEWRWKAGEISDKKARKSLGLDTLPQKLVDLNNPDTRFSQSNPALAAGMGTAQQLFKGPSAPMGIIDSAVRTASGVRQSMANKLEWWTDKATRVYGNLATDATGEASMRDRIEAASKVTHIALSKLMLGGLRKEKGFWEAYKTDHSYQDILNKLEEGVGKYAETPDFESMNKAFNMAATARREFELIKDKQMTWQGGEVNPTLDVNTQAKGITPQMDVGMRIYNEVPEIREALAIFEKFNNDGVDQLAKAGVIDQKTADMLKGTTGYVPWFREADDAEGNIKLNALSPKEFTRGLINKSNLRELEGRSAEDAQISNVLNNMAKLSGWMTSKTVGNDTAAYMVDFATKFGVAGKPFAKKVGMGEPNSVLVLENGVPKYYAFDDPMALPAFRGYESAHSAITQFLSAPANLVRAGVTAFPVFSISQLPQDAMRAFIDSDLKNPYALLPRILKNFVVELVGGGTESGKTLSKFGIVGRGGDIIPGEATRSLRRRLGYYDTGMGGTARKFWDKLEKLQAASDAASRTALYELTMEETKSKAFPDGNQALAIRKAREIINFDTQGSSGYSTFLRQTVPFMGVSMIALNNLYKGLVLGQRLSDKEASAARRSIIYHGTQIAVLTMLYTMLVGDTEDYKKLSDSERNRNFIIPGTGLSIPVPGDGLGFIFKVVPEQIARYTLAEGLESKDAGSKAGRALYKGLTNIGSFESYIPVVGSPLPKTFIELVLNENWYTGNAIVGKSKENLAPSQQYTDSTSEIAKQLGQALNLSPLKLDYVVRAMTGQLGGFTFAMTEAAMNAAQGKVTPSWDIRTFPGLSAFTYPSGKDRAALEDFYELRERVDVVARTYSDLAKVGKGKEALAYLAEGDNKRAYALRQFQTEAEKGLAKFRAARTLIINNPNIKTGEEMKQQLKELDDRVNAYLKSMRLPDKREFAQLTPTFDLNILKVFR